ncbi:terminal beta-(1-_2)-arabinofuranosyltransferase [Pseudonocardia yuanmonensis]|uniref:Terminal beta-(1->2)-arabinofuranosyltransferase n=1 Tax=Pseudonocardia yuanmonensis TaxID=1095914 RepID=A0ABP8WFJ0_9PSEU
MRSRSIDTVAPVHHAPVGLPPARPDRRIRPGLWNGAVLVLLLGAFAALIWNRRWMSDDGLIVLRTVRNLLAGDGPVFNAGERVEANTSTLWTYLLAIPGLVPGISLNWAAVVLGLLLSVAGLGLAVDAARRLHRARTILPAGALVVLALPPFWDFGTSGLETGLITGWLGASWWLLVRRLQVRRGEVAGRTGSAVALAVVVGLAPLVRPDLALAGLLVAVAVVVLEWRRSVRRLLGLAAVAAVAPVGYEIFRMGYYGLLVPSTALAKEASDARWDQGGWYLLDLAQTYGLWFAGAGVLLVAVALLSRRGRTGPAPSGTRVATAVVALTPVIAGLLLGLYVTRVGGDFMHGRMLLPALFSLLLPVTAVPATRWALVPVLGTLVWAAFCLTSLRPAYGEHLGPHWIANERLYYVLLLGHPHPVTAEDYATHPRVAEGVARLAAAPGPSLAIVGNGDWYVYPADGGRSTLVWLNLGVAGELAPLDVRVLDGVGLVNPVAGHATGVPGGRIGHDKDLLPEWFLAEAGVRGDTGFVGPGFVDDARRALGCPATVEMLASYRDPLTADRFRQNLTGAVERTSYRYPRDAAAAAASCGA